MNEETKPTPSTNVLQTTDVLQAGFAELEKPGTSPAPTAGHVDTHAKWLSVVMAVAAMLGTIGTLMPPPSLQNVAWFAPVCAICGMVSLVILAGVRAYNVPVLLLVVMLAGVAGCAPLPPGGGATPSQIQVAQDQITRLEDGYIAFTIGLDLVKMNATDRALVKAAEETLWAQLEAAYAAAGRGENIDDHDLTLALETFKQKVRDIQTNGGK